MESYIILTAITSIGKCSGLYCSYARIILLNFLAPKYKHILCNLQVIFKKCVIFFSF